MNEKIDRLIIQHIPKAKVVKRWEEKGVHYTEIWVCDRYPKSLEHLPRFKFIVSQHPGGAYKVEVSQCPETEEPRCSTRV